MEPYCDGATGRSPLSGALESPRPWDPAPPERQVPRAGRASLPLDCSTNQTRSTRHSTRRRPHMRALCAAAHSRTAEGILYLAELLRSVYGDKSRRRNPPRKKPLSVVLNGCFVLVRKLDLINTSHPCLRFVCVCRHKTDQHQPTELDTCGHSGPPMPYESFKPRPRSHQTSAAASA